jgi:hypothetical protein
MSTQPNPHIGSSFDAFLAEEGILEACEEQAIKELVAEQIVRAMQEQGLTRTAMAARMRTSRAALNRLLDRSYESLGYTADAAKSGAGDRQTVTAGSRGRC